MEIKIKLELPPHPLLFLCPLPLSHQRSISRPRKNLPVVHCFSDNDLIYAL